MMKRKPPTPAKLRKKLWELMSIYIRSTSANLGSETHGACYTCSKVIDLKHKCDVGHCYPKGAYESLRFDTRNLRIQCKGCNLGKQGEHAEFLRRLRIDIGDDEVDQMHSMRKDVIKRGMQWYRDEIEKYKQLINGLEFTI